MTFAEKYLDNIITEGTEKGLSEGFLNGVKNAVKGIDNMNTYINDTIKKNREAYDKGRYGDSDVVRAAKTFASVLTDIIQENNKLHVEKMSVEQLMNCIKGGKIVYKGYTLK